MDRPLASPGVSSTAPLPPLSELDDDPPEGLLRDFYNRIESRTLDLQMPPKTNTAIWREASRRP